MTGIDARDPITNHYRDVLITKAEISTRPGVPADPETLIFTELAGKLEGFTTLDRMCKAE